jgi:hypothetical protein
MVARPPKKGDPIAIVGEERNGYVPIVFIDYEQGLSLGNAITGFAQANLIFIDDGKGSKPPAITAPEGRSATLIRDMPMRSTKVFSVGSANIIKNLKEGGRIVVLGKANKNNWVRVWNDGQEGFIGEAHLKMD